MEKINSETNSAQAKSDKNSGVTVKPLEESSGPSTMTKSNMLTRQAIMIYVAVFVLGALLGGGVYAARSQGTTKVGGQRVQVVKTSTEEGVKDPAVYKDTATGKLVANDGKVTSEGTHILVRGDVSQNVYVTSTVVDLSKYENKVVQVWGQTYQGSDPKTGWLIDVGSVKIVE